MTAPFGGGTARMEKNMRRSDRCFYASGLKYATGKDAKDILSRDVAPGKARPRPSPVAADAVNKKLPRGLILDGQE
jgi:hypothetical protein